MTTERALSEEATNWRAIALGLGLAIVGLLLSLLADILKESLWMRLLSLLGGTVLSVGLIALIFEVAMRRAVAREMVRLVGVRDNLVAAQLKSANKANEVDWPSVFNGKGKFEIILQNPQNWIDNHLHRVIDCGRFRKAEIYIFPFIPLTHV